MTSFVPDSDLRDVDDVAPVDTDAPNDIDTLLLYMRDHWSESDDAGFFRSLPRRIMRRR